MRTQQSRIDELVFDFEEWRQQQPRVRTLAITQIEGEVERYFKNHTNAHLSRQSIEKIASRVHRLWYRDAAGFSTEQ